MFRPPEYAALINPINTFVQFPAISGRAMDEYFKQMMQIKRGPKEWSPIGKYEIKSHRTSGV
jgi:hypothetical protein